MQKKGPHGLFLIILGTVLACAAALVGYWSLMAQGMYSPTFLGLILVFIFLGMAIALYGLYRVVVEGWAVSEASPPDCNSMKLHNRFGPPPMVGMRPWQAVSNYLRRYFDFRGRASRSEFWWCLLFVFLVTTLLEQVNNETLEIVILWGMFIPNLSISARRLHDVNYSGWWQLLHFLPILGTVALFILWASPPNPSYGQRQNRRKT
jgi:hypothetical protein